MGKALRLALALALALVVSREALAACATIINVLDAGGTSRSFCRGTDGGTNYTNQQQLIDAAGSLLGVGANPLTVSVSNTPAVSQSGTWTVQPGNTANTTAWLVTGTGGTFPATQSGNWSVRLQDALGNGINSTSNALNVNLSGSSVTVTVAGSGTFTTSDTHFPATQALSDSIANPTVSGMTSFNMLWDSTNLVWRRAQASAGTGALQVAVVSGAAGGTNSNFGAVFPTAGTAAGWRNGSGNMDYALVDASHNVQISCGGQPCNLTDNSAFTAGTTGYANIGGLFQTTATTNACTAGNGCVAQLTANRALFINPRDSTGTEAMDTVNHAVKVNIVAGAGSGGTALADEAAFTQGTTSQTPIGILFTTSPTALTNGQSGVARGNSARQQSVDTEGLQPTYRFATGPVTSFAASATDWFVLTGSATKTVRVMNVTVCGIATAATTIDVLLIKRTTANTGGTSSSVSAALADSGDSAASATAVTYTANPTVTGGNNWDAFKLNLGATGGAGCASLDNGTRNGRALVLRGTAQQLALNFNATSLPAGASLDARIEETEE